MPLPIFIIGASIVGGLLINDQHKKYLKKQDSDRLEYKTKNNIIARSPSDLLPSSKSQKMIPGTIVCCHVYGGFEHTGIVIDDNLIIELHGSGLVKAVSAKRFLSSRSGETIFIACNKVGEAFTFYDAIERAQQEAYKYYDYHIFECNCYTHTLSCIIGRIVKLNSFEDFNTQLYQLTQESIYWDRATASTF